MATSVAVGCVRGISRVTRPGHHGYIQRPAWHQQPAAIDLRDDLVALLDDSNAADQLRSGTRTRLGPVGIAGAEISGCQVPLGAGSGLARASYFVAVDVNVSIELGVESALASLRARCAFSRHDHSMSRRSSTVK